MTAAVIARRRTNSRFPVGRLSLCAFDAIVLTRYTLSEPFIDSGRVSPAGGLSASTDVACLSARQKGICVVGYDRF